MQASRRSSPIDPALCRTQLEQLLKDEARQLDQLEGLLRLETEALDRNDLPALDQAGSARQGCVAALLRVEDERRSLCRMTGHATDLPGLERLIRWCDPHGSLATLWMECRTRAGRCREINDRNGAVVAAKLQRVTGMLGVISGRSSQPATYNPHGAYALAATRTLAAEA